MILKYEKRKIFLKYVKIAERAENEGLYTGERVYLLMDIESANIKFNLNLDDWLNADDFNFRHDLIGIIKNVVRDTFPANDFGCFAPRFSQKNIKLEDK